MAKATASVGFLPSHPRWRLRDLFRLASWGFCAAFSLFVALFAATTEVGHDRLYLAMAEIREIILPSGVKPLRPLDAREGRRLAETVRELAAEREALRTRVAALEQGLGGITGSIARVEQAAREPAWLPVPVPAPKPAPIEEAPSVTVPGEVSSSVHLPSSMPLPPPASASNAKTEFGLDLGNATSMEALRAAWTAASRRHGALLQGLRAVVQTRERGRAGAVELRLIAGPVASAATAARLCAAITAAGAVCAPATFEGQRLAVR